MKARPLVVITTRLPPQACGIGNYSWLAHKHRPKDSDPAEFLVMEGASQSRSSLNWNRITDFNGNPASLARALDGVGLANVLLHYAGRAYQRFGCPTWMPGVLARWKARFPQSRLTILFHELPGRLPFWSRHFLLGKLNARIIHQLCVLADALVTNTANHVAILHRLSGRDDIHFLPVGSNIEPVTSSSEPRASTEFIIFGLPFGRLQTLERFDKEIQDWARNGFLTAIHLIGPEDERFTAQADELIKRWPRPDVVVRHGLLPEAEISALFARAGFALTNVTHETWSKSGAFMACAATGCAPVISGDRSASIPLSYAIHASEVDRISEAERMSKTVCLKTWYYENADWEVTARQLSFLSENGDRVL